MWTIKNKKNHVNATYARFMSWMEEGCFPKRKKKFYKDANQTENFIRAKTKNDLYYRGKKHY